MPDAAAISPGDIRQARLEAGDVSVTVLSLGAITHDWRVPLDGARVPVVLGYADPADHLRHPGTYLGAIAGRVANRIAGARFTLDGQEYRLPANEGANQLHGGPGGTSRRNWRIELDGSRAVRLRLTSPDGDQGYPGRVEFTVTIRLEGNRLTYDMKALPDRPTPVNLAQHNYYNLTGRGDIRDHRLWLRGSAYTPVDRANLPTGDIRPVDGTRFDFRRERRLGAADPDRQGTDVNIVLDPGDGPVASLRAPNGMRLRMWSDQPGLQLYTGTHLSPVAAPLPGQRHLPFSGLCLEPQHFPDSPNQPQFPSIVCAPDAPYHQRLSVEIAPEAT